MTDEVGPGRFGGDGAMEELHSAVAAPPHSTLEHPPITDSSAMGLTHHIRASRCGAQ
jgi:hypothetical protein